MIGSLSGRLTLKQAPAVMIECGGVGYEVETPMSTFLDLPAVGETVSLHTHLQVRDTAHSLFGFSTQSEKALFRALLSVSGVGAKMALAILSGIAVDDFERCVQFEDIDLLVKIPGIGKKTAERLIIEMRDKIEKLADMRVTTGAAKGASNPASEAMDALVSLGYKPTEVKRLLSNIEAEGKSSEELIRLALRQTVK
ncbi:MAG: Holliday junction branch migration protein RuvA [Woeseia sp.]|nr:Holliday junction branch migration protein RuvA [Woeseia sp.]